MHVQVQVQVHARRRAGPDARSALAMPPSPARLRSINQLAAGRVGTPQWMTAWLVVAEKLQMLGGGLRFHVVFGPAG